ncbi:MAG: tetratricopeptide repeat protein [Spirochaetaceae bacterium]
MLTRTIITGVFAGILLSSVGTTVAAQTAFEEGEELFLRNKPREAVSHLEEARSENPDNEQVYLYLGIAYEQLGEREKAIEVLEDGIGVASKEKERMLLAVGNNRRMVDERQAAERAYGEAIATDSLFAPAYLARANLRVEMEKYDPAVEDYEIFLELRPDSEHREEIERMIALLRDKREEEERLAAEEEERRERREELARREEERRQEEEERRREEEERRRRVLLDSVLNSLEEAEEETENLPGGSEDIRELEEDVDIME